LSAFERSHWAAGKIRRMRNSFIGVPSRIAFFVCGMISISLGTVYRALLRLDLGSKRSWSAFSAVLMLVGVLGVVIALLPGTWVRKALRVEPTEHSLLPIKMMGTCAAASYLAMVGLSVASHNWRPSPELVFSICPACALAITVDPSPPTVLLLLAPLSAAVYGALGGELGYLSLLLRRNG
jgi:hypothetical protein